MYQWKKNYNVINLGEREPIVTSHLCHNGFKLDKPSNFRPSEDGNEQLCPSFSNPLGNNEIAFIFGEDLYINIERDSTNPKLYDVVRDIIPEE